MKKNEQLTACTLDCFDACSLLVAVEKDGKISLRGNPDHPFTAGFCCAKQKRIGERLSSPDRITQPLVRSGANYWPVSWDEALKLICSRLDRLRKTPERILHVQGYGYRGLYSDISRWFFRTLGASGTSGSPCATTGNNAFRDDFGSVRHSRVTDLYKARSLVNWGRDLTRAYLHLSAAVAKARKNGTHVLSITPTADTAREFSDETLFIRPGTDRFLAAALCRRLLAAGVSKDVQAATRDFPAFEARLAALDEAELLQACGVDKADLNRLVELYTNGPCATLVGLGLQRYVHGRENVRYINAAAMLSGNMGRSGGGTYYNLASGLFLRSWANDFSPAPPREMPLHRLGRCMQEEETPFEFVFVQGTNPVNQLPDGNAIADAFARTGFVVAVDAFFNDTTLRADVILPCALMLEREEIVDSGMHNCVNWAAKVCEPPEGVRNDWDIVQAIAERLEEPLVLPDKEEMLRYGLGPSVNGSLEELREKGFLPCEFQDVAYEGMQFDTDDGLYHAPEFLSDEERSSEYPLSLLSLVRKDSLHSQRLEEPHSGALRAWISPKSPALKNIDLNAPVQIVSPHGKLEVDLRLDDSVHPEALVVRRGGWMRFSRCVNPLVAPRATDGGGGIAYYSQLVRIENIR